MTDRLWQQLQAAVLADDIQQVQACLSELPNDLAPLNRPPFVSGIPLLARAKSIQVADLLLQAGADLQAVSDWWASGFGVFKNVIPDVGRFLIAQGAVVSAHAAAGMGLTDILQDMIDRDSAAVSPKGGDGATPLHFARDVETAEVLIRCGADPNARDDDHDSTAIQWVVGDRPEVAAFLLDHGANPDVFVCAALGDQLRMEQLVDANSDCLSFQIGRVPYPALGYQDKGGTMLQWSLRFNTFAHQHAAANGHQELFEFMMSRSATATRFLVACVMGLRDTALEIQAAHPGIVDDLDDDNLQLLPKYCWETNVDMDAVRLMLDLGFPIETTENRHGYSVLHNAAWGGYADLVDLLIERKAPLHGRHPEYNATPLDFALHCCLVDGRHPEGEYTRVVGSLIDAGSTWEPSVYPTHNDKVDSALQPRLSSHITGQAMLNDEAAMTALLSSSPPREALTLALIGAARAGHVALCQQLIQAGAAVEVGGHGKTTPLQQAIKAGSMEVLSLLLDSGADISLQNGNDSTVLHIAAAEESPVELIDLLMQHGAAPLLSVKNRFGFTPVGVAEHLKRTETAAYLRSL